MRTPAQDIKDALYERVRLDFARVIHYAVTARWTIATKEANVNEIVKTAYQAGLDQGYDMAHEVLGK
jgi:hypothetical protein